MDVICCIGSSKKCILYYYLLSGSQVGGNYFCKKKKNVLFNIVLDCPATLSPKKKLFSVTDALKENFPSVTSTLQY